MVGNVSEWTESSYYAEAYEFVSTMNPHVADKKNQRKVVRGGSWKDVAYFLQVSTRDYEYADSAKLYWDSELYKIIWVQQQQGLDQNSI